MPGEVVGARARLVEAGKSEASDVMAGVRWPATMYHDPAIRVVTDVEGRMVAESVIDALLAAWPDVLVCGLACPTCGGSGGDGYLDPNGEPNPAPCPDCSGSGVSKVRREQTLQALGLEQVGVMSPNRRGTMFSASTAQLGDLPVYASREGTTQ